MERCRPCAVIIAVTRTRTPGRGLRIAARDGAATRVKRPLTGAITNFLERNEGTSASNECREAGNTRHASVDDARGTAVTSESGVRRSGTDRAMPTRNGFLLDQMAGM